MLKKFSTLVATLVATGALHAGIADIEIKVSITKEQSTQALAGFFLEIKNVPYYYGETKSLDYTDINIHLLNDSTGWFVDKEGGWHNFSLDENLAAKAWPSVFFSMEENPTSITEIVIPEINFFPKSRKIDLGFRRKLYTLNKNSIPYFCALNLYNRYIAPNLKNYIGDNIGFVKKPKDLPHDYGKLITFPKLKIPYWFYVYDFFFHPEFKYETHY